MVLIAVPVLIELTGYRFTGKSGAGRDLLNQSPIGEIIRQQRTVRKRGETSLAFNTISPGDSLFVGDRILTGKGATARIQLSDGNLLELGPESLIRIEPVRSLGFGGIKRKIKITLESGTVKAATRPDGAPVVVENPKGEVILEVLPPPSSPVPAPLSAPVSAQPQQQEFVSAAVPETAKTQETQATLVSLPEPEPVPQPVPLQEAPVLPERPLLSRLTLALRPPVEEIRWVGTPHRGPLDDSVPIPDQKFKLQWKSAGYGRKTPYRIQIRESVQEMFLTSDREFIELPVPLILPREWEIQVETDMKNGETIRSKKIQLNWTLPMPQPVSPADRSTITPDPLRMFSKNFLLGWKEMPACPRFRIDFSRDELPFQPAGQAFETEENFIAIPMPESGVWKWRVHCIFAPGVLSSGPVQRFTFDPGIQK
jgi:hypothetical protein